MSGTPLESHLERRRAHQHPLIRRDAKPRCLIDVAVAIYISAHETASAMRFQRRMRRGREGPGR